MLALATHETTFDQPSGDAVVPDDWRTTLNALRVVALSCRVAARDDLFQACAMLSQTKAVARDAHARALVKCLREALGKAPIFYRPGEKHMSFDEAWLLRLIAATEANDGDSVTFLIASRIPPIHRRHIAFLARGIAAQAINF